MAQVGRLGPQVVSHLALLCIHRVNRVNSRNDFGHDDSLGTIRIRVYINSKLSYGLHRSTRTDTSPENFQFVSTHISPSLTISVRC